MPQQFEPLPDPPDTIDPAVRDYLMVLKDRIERITPTQGDGIRLDTSDAGVRHSIGRLTAEITCNEDNTFTAVFKAS